MRAVVLSRLRLQWTRYLLVLAVVAVSSGFMAAALALSSTLTATLVGDLTGQFKNADAMVMPQDGGAEVEVTDQQLGRLGDLDGVSSVWAQRITAAVPGSDAGFQGENPVTVSDLPPDQSLLPVSVRQGTTPAAVGQAMVSHALAQKLKVGVGDTVSLTPLDGTGPQGAHPAPRDVTITGLTEAGASGSLPEVWLSARGFEGVTPAPAGEPRQVQTIQVKLDGGASDDRLQDMQRSANEILEGGKNGRPEVRVITPEQYTSEILDQLSSGNSVLTLFLAAFAGLAVLVALLVVTNTLSVLTAQRARELALLRCVGATSRQVHRSVLAEGVVLGAVGAALGVGFVGVLAGLLRSTRVLGTLEVTVAPRDLLLGLLTGIVLTAVASLGPARRARGTSPLDGLRGSRAADRVPRVRMVLGAVILAAGATMLGLGAWAREPLLGIAGGLASFLGVVMTSRLYLPPLVRGAGRLLPGGQPSRLAAVNAARYPARTATTAAALLIGVLLVATVLTGQHVARVSLLNYLDQQRPVDIAVPAAAGEVSAEQVREISALDGVLGVKTTHPATTDGAVAQIDAAQYLDTSAASDLQEKVAGILDLNPGELQGALLEKASYVSILDIMLTVTLGLLAASVVVSVLGIASTMSLSVLERVRENSLLRALGLTRGQLGAMIRCEALVISLVATLVGIVVGWLLGVLGVMSLVAEGIPLAPAVPWAGFAAIVLGAVVVAVLASAAPVHRATRVSPVEGMARVD